MIELSTLPNNTIQDPNLIATYTSTNSSDAVKTVATEIPQLENVIVHIPTENGQVIQQHTKMETCANSINSFICSYKGEATCCFCIGASLVFFSSLGLTVWHGTENDSKLTNEVSLEIIGVILMLLGAQIACCRW